MKDRLRVAIVTADPARRRSLLRILDEAGHAPASREAAEVVIADGAAPASAAPLVLLSDAADPADAAAGLLPRAATPAQIDAALRAVAAGLTVRLDAARLLNGFDPVDDDPPAPLLTPRELEILGAVGDGLSNKAVARRLGISGHTVKFHLEAVFAKLGATTRAEAVAKGLRRGLIEI
jgi:DNA-binding CsgD family transcriptional regulator